MVKRKNTKTRENKFIIWNK